MSLRICILGSGSSGNCTAVQAGDGMMLIDIGFGPRATARRMAGTGAAVEDISAICLTHLDSDHFNRNWFLTIVRQSIRVHCHARLVEPILYCAQKEGQPADALRRLESLIQPFDGRPFRPLPDLQVEPIPLPHDVAGSHGFLLQAPTRRIGYATDLGSVPSELFERFEDLDILAIESNYDPQMQMASDRPWILKQRVMGGSGHLSNQQSFAAVRHILNRCEKKGGRLPAHIVLLHRSRQCNCPDLVRRLFRQDARVAERMILAEQHEPTGWIAPDRQAPSVPRAESA